MPVFGIWHMNLPELIHYAVVQGDLWEDNEVMNHTFYVWIDDVKVKQCWMTAGDAKKFCLKHALHLVNQVKLANEKEVTKYKSMIRAASTIEYETITTVN